jgi:hypothetical protein
MGNYKIYSGVKGKDPQFQYVKHNTTKEEALEEARELAIEIFENTAEFAELWDNCFEEVEQSMEENVIFCQDLYNSILSIKTNILYEELIDDFICFNVSLYEE